MGIELQFQRLCCVHSVKKLLSIFGIVIAVVAVISQLVALPYENYISLLSNADGVGFKAETDLATDEKRSNVEVDLVLGFQKLGNSTYVEKRLNANSTTGFYLNVSTYSSLGRMRNGSGQILQLKLPAARPNGWENVIADTGNKSVSLSENEATSSNSNMLRAGINSKSRRPASISYMNSLVQQNSSISLVV